VRSLARQPQSPVRRTPIDNSCRLILIYLHKIHPSHIASLTIATMSLLTKLFTAPSAGQIEKLVLQQSTGFRNKHSSTQIKRLFKRNPARRRVESRLGINIEPEAPPPVTYPPILEPKILSNGWSAPPGVEVQIPEYPFTVSRTKNKPNDSVGFLPVYSEYR
jgi:hypothetical protein